MKFLDKKALRQLIGLSIQYVTRLEEVGQFPRRRRHDVHFAPNGRQVDKTVNKLGQPIGRVYWVDDEVYDWMKKQVSKKRSD